MNKNFLLIAFLVLSNGLFAQNNAPKTYRFSVEEAVTFAVENNYSAINAGRDIDAAKQKRRETIATGLPQITAGVDYTNNFALQKSLVPAEFFGGQPGEFAELAFGTKHTMTARSQLSQLLFDGSYIVALQASRTYLKYFENYKQKTNIEVREMVINSYTNVLLAEENILILNKNKEVLDKILFDTNETFKNGLIEEENVEQLKITLSSVVSNLNYTLRLKQISINMLKLNLGIPVDSELILTDKLDQLNQANLDFAMATPSFDVKKSIDYEISQSLVDQRRLELKLEKSKALPSLSANMNFGYNAFGDDFKFTSSDQKWFNYSNLGLSLNIPIFSSFGRQAKTQQAEIEFDKAKTQQTEAEQQLLLQFQTAKSDYEFRVEQYTSAKENLRLAERIERKQNVKFTEGISSSFDFTDAQQQLYKAQQNYLQSMVDVINTKATLDKLLTIPN
ncbi:TolC family protein [Flavobacterium tegetincola]|uniref:TolC family protein n=1 Tax=Flavobacterium tegetincola TaxID=150172 RepID=UPI00041A0826|nr:TolC family protein [Flavobacterium tegetincola]